MLYVLKHDKPLWIKQAPSIRSRNIGLIKPGDIVSISDEKDGWYHILNGYVYGLDKNKKSLFDSSIQSTSYSDKVRKIPPKIRGRFFDRDEVPSGSGEIFPETSETWTEDGYKVTTSRNVDGTWTMTKVKSEGGTEERITHVYDREGTLTTKEEAQQSNGYRDTVYTNRDGSKSTVTYEQGEVGQRTRVDREYDSDGNLVSETRTPIDEEHGALSQEAGLQALGATGMDDNITNSSGSDRIDIHDLNITSLYGIHGIPYQYMSIVDRAPISGEASLGRLYADRIVARMPLLIITPGEPEFMAGWGDDEKSDAWREVLTMVNAGSDLSKITQREGRYYSFKPTWDLYVQYVAPLTQAAAHFLGIHNAQAPVNNAANVVQGAVQGSDLGSFRWDSFYNDSIHGKLNYRQSVAFYVHSDTQVSDNFSNQTGKSQLEQKINSFSDLTREVNFMLGTLAGQTGMDMRKIVGVQNQSSENVLSNAENLADFTDGVLGKGNFLESIAGNLGAVINGGKLIFPEIWTDSDFIKTYNITIKLRCPNPDPVSWYFDIWAPIAHLLPLVLPKQAGMNGYISPFLVRAYFKGIFNCQMGIITNMTITRGEKGNWTLKGLPASVDVNMTIKDLYSVLQITRESLSSDEFTIMKNIGILDYISNICGININEPDLKRLLTMFYFQKANTFNVLGGRTYDAIDQWATNYALNMKWAAGLGRNR